MKHKEHEACACGVKCNEVENNELDFQVWHCPSCDIDFYYDGHGELIVIS